MQHHQVLVLPEELFAREVLHRLEQAVRVGAGRHRQNDVKRLPLLALSIAGIQVPRIEQVFHVILAAYLLALVVDGFELSVPCDVVHMCLDVPHRLAAARNLNHDLGHPLHEGPMQLHPSLRWQQPASVSTSATDQEINVM